MTRWWIIYVANSMNRKTKKKSISMADSKKCIGWSSFFYLKLVDKKETVGQKERYLLDKSSGRIMFIFSNLERNDKLEQILMACEHCQIYINNSLAWWIIMKA